LAELIAAVESGEAFAGHAEASRTEQRQVVGVEDLAPLGRRRTVPARPAGTASGSVGHPKTAMTVADNFRFHILPTIGTRPADRVSGLDLDHLYDDKGLSPEVTARCHGQIRAVFNCNTASSILASLPPAVGLPTSESDLSSENVRIQLLPFVQSHRRAGGFGRRS
jgi:hypothetical protein